jgi:hypothetical protein
MPRVMNMPAGYTPCNLQYIKKLRVAARSQRKKTRETYVKEESNEILDGYL